MDRTRRTYMLAAFAAAVMLATGARAQEDYSRYRVLDTRVIHNMWAGPARSAALLSPDGSRLLHLGHRDPDMCLFAPAQIGSWVELACADYTDENRPLDPQEMAWSPTGDALLMPTYQDAAGRFQDTDVRIFDAATFSVRNLTDDGFDGGIEEGVGPMEVDVLAQWGGDDKILFVRHSIPAGGKFEQAATSLMSIAADGGEPQKLLDIHSASNFPVWNFAASSRAGLMAYSVEDKQDAGNAGLYVLATGSAEPRRVADMPEDMRLKGLAFSADGKFLLLLGLRREDLHTVARVLDLATGAIVPVDASQNIVGVAWSPTGSALAYLTQDDSKPEMPGGLFLSPAPGKPARLLIGGAFHPPVCCGDRPMIWAANDTLVFSQTGPALGTVLYVQLGE